MKHKENSRMYKADDGKMLVRKSDGKIMGDGISLGRNDSIDNYEERGFTEEERAAFWKSVGRPDPKKRLVTHQPNCFGQTERQPVSNKKQVKSNKKPRSKKAT